MNIEPKPVFCVGVAKVEYFLDHFQTPVQTQSVLSQIAHEVFLDKKVSLHWVIQGPRFKHPILGFSVIDKTAQGSHQKIDEVLLAIDSYKELERVDHVVEVFTF